MTILGRITAPLLAPGILSVGIFLIMAMVHSFDLPMIIGLTARIPVLSTRIYTAAAPDSGLPNYGLTAAFGPERAKDEIRAIHPFKCLAEPIDVANAALFLASDESRLINGSDLIMDGGLLAQ